MDCGGISDRLGFYIDGALPEGDRVEVEKHLSECAECRAELASLRLLIQAAGEIEAVEPPIGLRASIAAATTAKPESARHRLRELLSPRLLRWAGGLACAAAGMVLFVGLTHTNEPANRAVLQPRPPAPMSNRVATARPAPVRIALATSPITGLREVAPPARIRHSAASRASKPAAPAAAPAPKVKLSSTPKSNETRGPERLPAIESGDEAVAVDDTTAARTVAAADIQEPAPEITDTAPERDRAALTKVASSPALSRDNAEEWIKNMKAEAAMRRKSHGSNVVSVINARF